ncbi:MAG: type 4a pilus biogenesis protein PilO [Candidatus Omnitrophica bacterium]|nr:type 4a pilus biogenesis protein PilO [Candidatus Omnitrophota bacterium]
MNIKFDIKNRKDIVTGAIFLLVVVIVLQFIYLPKYGEVKRLSTSHKEAKEEIEELYDFIGGQENLQDNIVDMRKNLALLESAFPFEKGVSDIIKQLNEEAKRFKVNVVSLKPENFNIYRDDGGRELKIADYFCKCMPLTLNVKARYRNLGEFLMSLETNKSPMVSVDEVDIERDEDISPWVEAEVDLTAHILGK